MESMEAEFLKNLSLWPWIVKAFRLRLVPRKIYGGTSNMFRHQMSTLSVLIDHGCNDPIVLKCSLVHDLLEEFDDELPNLEMLRPIDSDTDEVLKLLDEITKRNGEEKQPYLIRACQHSSDRAIILKAADRIDNLLQMDLSSSFSRKDVINYLKDTESIIIPAVESLNKNMAFELTDISKKLKIIHNI